MSRNSRNPVSPRPIPKSVERNLLRGTGDEGYWREPPPPPRPFQGKTILDDLARERCAITGQTPLEFLLEVMRDSRNALYTRLEAAKAAAPYVHARLARVENKIGPADGSSGQVVFLGGVLAPPRKELELTAETLN